jgi:hypothetical protein
MVQPMTAAAAQRILMLRLGSFLLLTALLASPAPAQTTGVAGINDYTINGLTAGSTSCPNLCFPAPTVLTLSVSTAPGNPVMMFFTPCACRVCSVAWFANGCLPLIPPALTPPCNGTTNQSLDMALSIGCPIVYSAFLIADAAGIANLTLSVPTFGTAPCAATFSTQAVVFDVCGTGGNPVGPGPFVLTQAYTVNF